MLTFAAKTEDVLKHIKQNCLSIIMKKVIYILLICLTFLSCKKDEGTPYAHRIIAIASANGIGDKGYLDVILLGFEQVYYNLDRSEYMQICTPLTTDEAYQIALNNIEKAKDGVPTLIMFGSSEYLPIVEKLEKNTAISGRNVSVLLFEVDSLAPASNNINYYSFIITTYKACYNAGKYVADKGFKNPLIWLSNPIDVQMDFFRDGFSDGYYDVTGKRPDVKYLADDYSGYNMSDSAYRAMSELDSIYDFIFPVMGGSNLGIYRYLRENPDGPYVAGMDVDQSRFAKNIIGCIIKNIDRTVVDFANDWIAGKEIPQHQVFDASSGYIEWRVIWEVANQ